jgi:hypothetical protein
MPFLINALSGPDSSPMRPDCIVTQARSVPTKKLKYGDRTMLKLVNFEARLRISKIHTFYSLASLGLWYRGLRNCERILNSGDMVLEFESLDYCHVQRGVANVDRS